MEFESRICTTKEQSEKLLSLGLKRETADMHHYKWSEGYWDIQSGPPRGTESCYIPAWSMGRLWEMLPKELELGGVVSQKFLDSESYIGYEDSNAAGLTILYFWEGDIYDRLIACFQWLAEVGYIDSEYIDTDKLFSL